MRALTAQDVVQVWERGRREHPVDRALTLLAAASPGTTRAALAALSIGRRDARLLALYERTFGGPLHCGASCPRCSSRVEFSAAPAELRAGAAGADERSEGSSESRTRYTSATPSATDGDGERIADGDIELRFRLPTSVDLAAAAHCATASDARATLVRRCVTAATERGAPVDIGRIPETTLARLAEQMAACDPSAEIVLGLTCPACTHRWLAVFDIAEFFWAELASHARRLLTDVHVLAQAYGWREADILAMSSTRRQFYLEMVGA